MITAQVSQLKNRLSAFLDLVRAGQTVLVLDRANPIASLVPIKNTDEKEVDELILRKLELAGVISSGGGKILSREEIEKLAVKTKERIDVLSLIDEEREDRL